MQIPFRVVFSANNRDSDVFIDNNSGRSIRLRWDDDLDVGINTTLWDVLRDLEQVEAISFGERVAIQGLLENKEE